MLCRGSLQRGLRVAALGIALGAPMAPAADTIVFGPQTFTRASGGPVTVKRSFSVTTPSPARLHVTNAGVTNGVITLNGIGIIRPADFLDPSGAVVARIDRPITLRAGANEIDVLLRGRPGTSLSVEIVMSASDTTPPTITAAVTPAPNANGWNNTNVTVTFACADAGSGVKTCPAPVTLSTDGATQVVSGTAVDNAGNSASTSVTVNVDKTAPVVTTAQSPAANANGWYEAPVTVHFTCVDGGSGIATCPADVVVGTEGTQTVNGTATDQAGNSASVTTAPIRIDLSAPSITVRLSPAANANGWNNGPVTAHFTCADSGAGVTTCPSDQVFSNDGANQTATGTAIDGAGRSTSATSDRINIDQAPAAILVTLSPSPNENGWYSGAPVTAHFVCVDPLSGVLSCPPDQSATTDGIRTFTGTVTDKAGNITSVTSDPVRIDLGAPTITASLSPPPNASGWNNGPVSVHFACADGGSGIKTCPSDRIVTSEGFGQSVTGTAVDQAGNSAVAFASVSIDTTAPVLTFTTPTDGSTVQVSTIAAAGSAHDDLSGIFSVTCNGAPAAVAGDMIGCNVSLARGANAIAASATDRAGNTTSLALSVSYARVPVARITSPDNLSYLNISPTTVTGTVDDDSAVVTVNSIPVPTANGVFTLALPLAEGPNVVTASATSPEGAAGTASIDITLDTTPPHVTITSPPDQFVTTESTISVSGNVNDIVVGTVNELQAQVTVNGAPAVVANRTFLASNVPLTDGPNTLLVIGRDRVGNAAATEIIVTRRALTQAQIRLVSGNNQSAAIASPVAVPLIVELRDRAGQPAVNQPVVFKLSQNDGVISGAGAAGPSAIATTDTQGRASAHWTLGHRAGAGGNGVEAYAVGFEGVALFTASGVQGAAGKIVVDAGNDQIGLIGEALPKPFIAVVVDGGNNRLAGVPVTFSVIQGGGSFNGQPIVDVVTDPDGRAAATLTLGTQEGNANNFVQANFPSNQSFAAGFMASGRAPGNPADTTISGVVLDNSNAPIPSVTVRAVLTNVLHSNVGAANAAPAAQTDAQGQFTIAQAPVGFVKLLVDGATAPAPTPYPSLEYDMVTIAGQNNTVGQPVYLVALNPVNRLCVTSTSGGGTLTIPEAPGFSLTFIPGQVTFPGGSQTGCVSVTVVNGDKVPMVPGFGQQPRFIVTIQPSGAIFSPPAAITLPNVDGLAPREVTEMYSFDHDIGSFVAIGTGVVSDDGLIIRSSPGVGVLKAGWHCGGNPSPTGAAANCPACQVCQTDHCESDPSQNGQTLPNDKCQICKDGSPEKIELNETGTEIAYTFGPPAPAIKKVNDALDELKKIAVIASVSLLEITGKLSQTECCDPLVGKGKGSELEGSFTGDFGGFSIKAKIWPLGPIPSFDAKIDFFGLASLEAKAEFVGGVFLGLTGKVTGQVGYKKKECSKDPADQAGCVFAKLELGLTPSITAEIGGEASVTFDCFFCDKTTITVAASFIAGELSWPISLAGVQYNTESCSSGLAGGFFNFGDGKFKVSVKFSGSYKTTDTGSRKVDVTFDFVSCTINSSGVSCTTSF